MTSVFLRLPAGHVDDIPSRNGDITTSRVPDWKYTSEDSLCLSQLHHQRSEDLKAVFPDYVPKASENGLNPQSQRPFETSAGHFPSSIYFQIVA